MGFQVFEEEEPAQQVPQQPPQKSLSTSMLSSKTHNIQKSNSAPSKLEGVNKPPKVNTHRQALADAAAMPPKKAAAAAKKTSIKKTEGISVDELRRARRAETLRKQGLYGASNDTKAPRAPKKSKLSL
ncbi:hypothetical protein E3P91_03142 [Wallemia ichthyophaga]|nr:hypothetical protein E3P91_03142 [Wallemia ichthyophaga]